MTPEPRDGAVAAVESLLDRCTFLESGSPAALAVSGGADSLALLVLAARAGLCATAYHVDHGLRPSSADEAHLVREAAKRFGADFVSLRVEVPKGPNLEARARAARYAVLPAGVATGHTADDQAETILINLLRGAGPRGLSGMTPGPRHPILALRGSETRALVSELGLTPVEDESNGDPSFVRNRVRNELLPLLDEIARRDVVPVITRQADILRAEDEFLDGLAAGVDPLDAALLTKADPVLVRRAIRQWLREAEPEGHNPSAATVERVMAVARKDARACDIGRQHRVRRSKGRLRLESQPQTPKEPRESPASPH